MNDLNIAALPQPEIVPNSATVRTHFAKPHLAQKVAPIVSVSHIALPGRLIDFWEIWLAHRDYLYRFCLKWTGQNHVAADELLSLSRDKAKSKWAAHAHKMTNPKSWLSSLIKHLYIDLCREKTRQNRVQSELQKEALSGITHQPSPESDLLGNELKACVHQLVTELPLRLREPFVLRFYQEKSYKEVAFQLDLSKATAYKRIQQARQQLRKPLRLYLAGLSQVAVDTDANNLKDLTIFTELGKPLSCAPDVAYSERDSMYQSFHPPSSLISYGLTATCLETVPQPLLSQPFSLMV